MKKITDKKLIELISEEKQANKMYKSYGFKDIAKQEKSHAIKLSKILRARQWSLKLLLILLVGTFGGSNEL